MKISVVVIALALGSRVAAAQESPAEAARRELIAQAEAASAQEDHARALDLARRAAALRPSASLTAFVAREHRALGRFVEALDEARACLRAAEADLALRNRDTILHACEAVRASVEPRVGRLEISVATPLPRDITVRTGDREVLPALYGVAFPVMPGAVRVEAAAPGYRAFAREVEVAAGALARVEVTLAPEPAPEPVVAPASEPVVAPAPAPSVTPHPPERASRSVGAGPWALAGVSVAGFVAGGVLYGLALSAQGERDAACGAAGCLPSAQSSDARYADLLTGASAAFVTGAAALAGGVIWYVVARLGGARSASIALQPNGFRF